MEQVEESSNPSIKLAANLTIQFNEYDSVYQRYEEAHKAGFQGVELQFPYSLDKEKLVNILNMTGMEQVLLNSYPGDLNKKELGLGALPDRITEFEKTFLNETLGFVDALKCKKLHIMSGITFNHDREECLNVLEKNLRFAIPYLQERDIIAVIEPINNESVPGYILNNYDEALNLVKKINSPYLKLQLDIFHLQKIHGNLTKRIKDMFPYIGHVQIAQVPDRNEPDTSGEINFPYIFKLLLNDLKYTGWIGLEYKPLNRTCQGLGWIKKYELNSTIIQLQH